MTGQSTDIRTPDGLCEAYVACPDLGGPYPAVLMYMDGIGFRDTLKRMADRLAAAGYLVLLPNLYYRLGRAAPVDVADVLRPENRPRLTERVQSITPAALLADADGFLDYLDGHPRAKPGHPIGVVGYCMGGAHALRTAAHLGARVAAAASFHGGRLATDGADSPHLLAPRIRAELYIGHAHEDPAMTTEQIARLDQALAAAQVRYRAELYDGARHGWTMADLPAYDAPACEKHWDRLLSLYASTLKQR